MEDTTVMRDYYRSRLRLIRNEIRKLHEIILDESNDWKELLYDHPLFELVDAYTAEESEILRVMSLYGW